jgi:ferredoxin
MKLQTFLFTGLIAGLSFFILTCSGLFYDPEDVPKSVSWIDIKTGLTDSFALSDNHIQKIKETYPDSCYNLFTAHIGRIIDSGGFDITWNGVRNASYYEIRVLKKRITESNWENALLVKTVKARPTSRMFTSIKELKPKVKGNNCTGCEYCVAVCPNNAITIFRKKAVIDLSLCTGCGKCYDTCTYNAVTNSFFGESYYFAVRSFSESEVGSEQIASTVFSYKLRYKCFRWKPEKDTLKQICGACGAKCFILNEEAEEEGCPVGAILYDNTGTMFNKAGMVYIDQSKCIYCGNCVTKCMFNSCGDQGYAAIRREVVSSELE